MKARCYPSQCRIALSAAARIGLADYQGAVQDTTQALKIDPNWFCANFTRGRAYTYLGEYQKAIDDFDIYLAAMPYSPQGYVNRGRAYAKLGNTKAAVADWKQAAEIYKSRSNTEEYEELMQSIREWENL